MKRLLIPLLTIGILSLAPTAAQAAPKQVCVYSPTRGWELVDGGKQCKKKTLRFFRVARRHLPVTPAGTACKTRKPNRVWRCSSNAYRTMNEQGDILQGRIVKQNGKWRVKGLHYPPPPW